jgi:hypothetical protein
VYLAGGGQRGKVAPRLSVVYGKGVAAVAGRTPSYCHHKATGQAVVRLNGQDHYLGKYDTPESRAEYDRLIAQWLANARQIRPKRNTPDVRLAEVGNAYLAWADGYYVKNGTPTTEPVNIRLALRPLRQLYGHTLAQDFGPLALKVVR